MSWVIWVVGPPGGDTSAARVAADRLAAEGGPVTVLEVERLRRVLTPDTSDGTPEREIVYRALVFMAVELATAGRPVLIVATGDRRQWREQARACLERFAEVRMESPHSSTAPPELAAEQIVQLARKLAAGAPGRGDIGGGAAIWLTGLPGSGKTTLASRLAETLHGDGVPVTLLEWVALRASLFGDGCPSAADLEVGHRALALTAAHLAEAGLMVIVDATAPRRAWRRLGRAMIGRFAEVQLLCPPETCAVRERDVRWRPRRPPVSPGSITIDWPGEYEYADCPELTLDTAVRSEWTATEDLRALARRLLRGGVDGKEAPCASEIS